MILIQLLKETVKNRICYIQKQQISEKVDIEHLYSKPSISEYFFSKLKVYISMRRVRVAYGKLSSSTHFYITALPN